GNNTTTESNIPVQVHNLTNVTRIDAGVAYSLALLSDGTIWTWGDGEYGQLGDGTWTDKKVPVQVNLTGCINAASGGWHALALKSDGTVWAWGSNSGGKLGDGTTISKNSPVQVDGLNLLD
ncbi:MAG: RCC1 repeat-containing protein, partial [Clostridia bacterium]|nr:RCC1 repeat-containing protein [Clostridia bacterium]